MSLNRCEFIGNLGRDPEIRTFNSGDRVANLSIAVSEKWKDRNTGERREKTEWIPITVFGSLVGVVEQYLRKGSKVYIAGKWQTRKWQDQAGNDRYSTECVLRGFDAKLVMLDGASGGRSDDRREQEGQRQEPQGGGPGAGYDDEIPF